MKKHNKKCVTKDDLSQRKKAYRFYSYSLKRQVVNDILKGILSKEEALLRYGIRSRQSINDWIRKYSLLNYRKEKNYGMKQSPSERIKELESRVLELENAQIILNTVIDIADEELGSEIRKKYLPQQLKSYKKHKSVKVKVRDEK